MLTLSAGCTRLCIDFVNSEPFAGMQLQTDSACNVDFSAVILKILGFIAEGPIEGPVGATLLQCVQTVTNSVDVCKP